MILPSSVVPPTTESVGWFRIPAHELAEWLAEALGPTWIFRHERLSSIDDVATVIPQEPRGGLDLRYLLLPVADWTALLNTGFLGTDLGVLPSHATSDLGITSIRAVAKSRRERSYPATILEVFDPSSSDGSRTRRSIYAADDGGRWVSGQFGDPFPFEDLTAYELPKKRDRFTPAMLAKYLDKLGVPIDTPPSLDAAFVVERSHFVGKA